MDFTLEDETALPGKRDSGSADTMRDEEGQSIFPTSGPPPCRANDLDPAGGVRPSDHTTSKTSSLSKNSLSGKQLRRKNRRQLYRLLKNPNVVPSFLKVIEGRKKIKTEPGTVVTAIREKDEISVVDLGDDSDEDFLLEPPKVVIDVDEYIGLKKKRKFSAAVLSLPLQVASNDVVAPITVSSNAFAPQTTNSSFAGTNGVDGIPSDEGWYEGTYPMAIQPDDTAYLSEFQVCIRENLEYFSATPEDCTNISGRRKPTVPGQVGIRCIHCARALRAAQPQGWNGRRPKMPPGSVSYPVNMSALYSLAIQKPQHHFEHCPNLPAGSRLNAVLDMLKAKKNGESSSGLRRRMKKNGITAVTYWHVSCYRLGLVELKNMAGLRFGRDLKLDLLPFDMVRSNVEQEHPTLFLSPKQMSISSKPSAKANVVPNRVGSMDPTVVSPAIIAANVLEILKKAKEEERDGENCLIFKKDAAVLSDFMFLTTKQMALCHAIESDFATRGKKTKQMRIGFAGFCCRHCKRNYPTNGTSAGFGFSVPKSTTAADIFQNSCRSFTSVHENLGSAVSNMFVLHLMKCPVTPQRIKDALRALKRVHSKQMQQLPRGSQSRFFLTLWKRIRAADKPLESDTGKVLHETIKKDGDEEYIPETIRSSFGNHTGRRNTNRDSLTKYSNSDLRPTPAIDAKEIKEILKNAEESWEPGQNDNLIQREDRNLISDFVFLCMRQLKVAIPTALEQENRKMTKTSRVAGLCCMHCSGQQFITTGRCFPSTADNLAGALNVSLYKHILNCPNVPLTLKRVIDALRKMHSEQCSRLPFGSQRRFLKRLFSRLQNVSFEAEKEVHPVAVRSLDFAKALRKYAFVETKAAMNTYWQCTKCRMVPFDYRAPGSLFFSRPSADAMEKHSKLCQKDGIQWDNILFSMKSLEKKYGNVKALVTMESFFEMVRTVVGNETEVIDTYMVTLGREGRLPEESFAGGIWRRLPTKVDFNVVEKHFSALRNDLNLPPGSLRDFPDFLNFLRLLSCNFVPLSSNDGVEKESTIAFKHQKAPLSIVQSGSGGKQAPEQLTQGLKSNTGLELKERSDMQESANINSSLQKTDKFFKFSSVTNDVDEEVQLVVQPTPKGSRQDISLLNGNQSLLVEGTNICEEILLVKAKCSGDQGNRTMECVVTGQFDDAI